MNGEAPAQVTPPPIFPESKPTEPQAPEPAPSVNPPAEPGAADPGSKAPNEAGGTKAPENPKPPEENPKGEERVVPERYDLKLPEDSMMDQASLARVESYAKANQLTQEEAADLVKAQDADVKAYVSEKKSQWLKEVQNDRELGGENLQRNVETATKFLDKHADPDLRRELTRTGYGNYPGFMRFVLKLAKMSENDKAVLPGANQSVPERSTADLFYADTTSKNK